MLVDSSMPPVTRPGSPVSKTASAPPTARFRVLHAPGGPPGPFSHADEERPVTDAPPARRLLLGTALRQYREGLGYVLDDAARVLDCDRSKISRIETGHRGIRPKELRELLIEYGVSDQAQNALAALTQAGRRDSWWQPYASLIPEPYQEYLALEQAASQILIYDPQPLPALLCTPDYAQATAAAEPADAAQQALARLTLTRQQALARHQPRLTALIGET